MRAGLRLTLMIPTISEVSSKEERRAMTEGLRIAIVRADDGHTTVCGPHDFKEPYYNGAVGCSEAAGVDEVRSAVNLHNHLS